jgi:predicted dehydrogenase
LTKKAAQNGLKGAKAISNPAWRSEGASAKVPLRAALIGAGKIAAEHLACLREMRGVEIAAICDRSEILAEVAASRFGAGAWYDDHRRMLNEVQPHVVHVTTPAKSHATIAADALNAGAHVIVEKPLATTRAAANNLLAQAEAAGRLFVEDYNYLFNLPMRRLSELRNSGELGEVLHVEVLISLDIISGGTFVDPNLPHPALLEPGGAIMDFLPHMACLAHTFVGPHRSVSSLWQKRDPSSFLPIDEFRALIDGQHGTASLVFSAHAQPDIFQVRVLAERMRATASLFTPGLIIERVRTMPRPLVTAVNSLVESYEAAKSAFDGLWAKVSRGPGSYEGLWELLRRFYAAATSDGDPPVPTKTIAEVNALVWDIIEQERP